MVERLKFIALGAGDLIKNPVGMTVKKKSGRQNYVTSLDLLSQEFIRKNLAKFFPGVNIISEEASENSYDDTRPAFVVDPVDGTTNLMYGLRLSAISIAYYADGAPQSAVVYNPFMDEMFWAERGGGAFLNGQPIKVTQSAVEDALVGFGTVPYDRSMADVTFGVAAKIFQSCRELRRTGSAAIDMCYVACGRYDAFYELALHPWDFAAGRLIVEEADGRCTTVGGQPMPFTRLSSVLATNGVCHEGMMGFFSGVKPPCDDAPAASASSVAPQPKPQPKTAAPPSAVEPPVAAAPQEAREAAENPGNPWLSVRLEDYEAHMAASGQAKTLDSIMLDQMMLLPYDARASAVVAVLGVAGGVGLQHAEDLGIGAVLGFDINEEYIKVCRARYATLRTGLALQTIDFATDPIKSAKLLRKADLIIANLFIEHIGAEMFSTIVKALPRRKRIISCVLQDWDGAVATPYADRLRDVAAAMERGDVARLSEAMEQAGYYRSYMSVEEIGDGKKLRRVDYRNEWNS